MGAPSCFSLVGLYRPRYCAHLVAAAPVAPRVMEPEQQVERLSSVFIPRPSVRNNENKKYILQQNINFRVCILNECAVKCGAIVIFTQTNIKTNIH